MNPKALRAVLHEFAAALAMVAVFALVFLYQPLPPAFAAASYQQAAFSPVPHSLCVGGAFHDDQTSHGSCHACRQKTVLLPPPPAEAVAAYDGFVALVFVLKNEAPPQSVFRGHYNPRAPPLAV